MTSVGWATLDVIPSFKGLSRELDRGTAGPLAAAGSRGGTIFGDNAGKAAGTRFGAIFKKAATAGLIGLAGAGTAVVKLGSDSIAAASDLEESTNKVEQIFGDAADTIFRFTERTADAFGQTNQQARDAAATFGLFGNLAGLSERKSAKFSIRMTKLASDLASFHNTEPDQAIEALGAALRGESEPIRAFGVLLDEATLKAEAMRIGLIKPTKDKAKIRSYQVAVLEGQQKYNEAVEENGKKSLEALKAEANLGTARDRLKKATEGTIEPLTQQQKVLAAQSSIFKQTEVAQGDFARTSDGLANQQRRLSARFEDAKAKLGVGLLPIMTQAADFLLDKGIPAFEDFSVWFNEKGIPAIKDFSGFVEDASGKVGDLISFVRDLPKPAQFAGLAALIGGAGALKLRGGGGGALGTAGKAFGLAKPVPVFVTNKGFGVGDGLGGGTASKGGKVARYATNAGKALPPLLLLGGALYELDKGLDNATKGSGKRTSTSGVVSQFGATNEGYLDFSIDPNEVKKKQAEIAGLTAKVDVFRDSLFLAGSTKVEPRFGTPGLKEARDGLAKFIGQQVEAGKPVTPYINTTSIERAIALARTLDASLPGNSNPNAGVDNGAGYMSGGTGTNGRAPTIGTVNIQAHDYNDFLTQTQRRTQQAGLGGFN